MKGYFVRFSGGTALFVIHELQALQINDYTQVGNRTILLPPIPFPNHLLQLRSVDDVFIHIDNIKLTHKRTALSIFQKSVLQFSLKKALRQIRQLRNINSGFTFSISTSFRQKTNYKQTELLEIFKKVLLDKYTWAYTSHENDAVKHLSFRLLLEDGILRIGLRLGRFPLHRRSYKQFHQKGSLKPTIAYCMARLADIEPQETVYDPMCGVGTILIEAALAFKPYRLIGTDRDFLAIQGAKGNAQLAQTRIEFMHQNALTVDFPSRSIHCILCNIPWGKQILTPEELPILYHQMLEKWAYLLQKSGRIVVLTDEQSILEKSIIKHDVFEIQLRFPIQLFGRKPVLYLLTKQ